MSLATCCFAQDPMQFAPFMRQRYTPTDWELRVLANGGAQPSLNTVNAMETLRLGCIAAGLTNKIHGLCVGIDGSIIASATPLFLHSGYPMWTNNFVDADVNINGIKGNGTTKAMDTGIKAKDVQIPVNGATLGMTVIVTEGASNQLNQVMGYRDPDGVPLALLLVSSGGSTEFYATTITALQCIITNDWGRVGYVSGNRTTNGGATNLSIYVASPLESHKVLTNLGGSIPALTTTVDDTISVFAAKRDGTNQSFSSMRLSMAMVHDGFTESESSNFWNLAKACRETLGGGTGDNIHDYNRKIVAAGGADISTTTSNALRTFYSGLDTDSTLYRIIIANPYVPDNLTAVRTPLIWQAGSEIWTNVVFGSTNLTVNGLTGNTTTKSLGVGINLSTLNKYEFSDTSAGVSLQIYNAPTSTGSLMEFGTAPTTASGLFGLQHFGGGLYYYCWRFINVNTDFISRAVPSNGTNWAGYISGNRTAANAIRMDVGTNGVHQVWTNATGSTVSVNNAMTNSIAHAIYVSSGTTAANWSDRTISFLALHPGLTQTESSNLYQRVYSLRTALGGGNP